MDGPTLTKQNEGCNLVAYRDSLGYWTIGYGHKLNVAEDWAGTTWTQNQADVAFATDYERATNGAAADAGIVCWNKLNEPRQAVLADMAFELGEAGLGQFYHFLSALLVEDYAGASAAMLQSLYATQVPDRAQRNAQIIESGEWPNA